MELFAKSKNRLYTRLVDLSHELGRRGTMPLAEIHRFLTRDNFVVEGLISKWLDPDSTELLSLLVEAPNGEYRLAVEEVLPILPSVAELKWLGQLVAHDLAPAFLDEVLIDKLSGMLGDQGSAERFMDVHGRGQTEHDSETAQMLRVLIQADQEEG